MAIENLAAQLLSTSTNGIPDVYRGTQPTLGTPSLSPLQLALLSYLATGTPPPLTVNNTFLQEMKTLSDSDSLSPATIDYITDLPRNPDIAPGYTGIGYISLGDEVYLLRQAEECGPSGEVRHEYVRMGTRAETAEGTFAYYGGPIENGTVSRGSGTWEYVYNTELNRQSLTYNSYEREDSGGGSDD